MDDKTRRRYAETRRKLPFLEASRALLIAKADSRADEWEASRRDGEYTKALDDGFTARLRVEDESIYPRDDDTYGHYVGETRYWQDYRPEWRGNYPPPDEEFPLGLPYTSFRYHGPGWVQGEGTGYFVPDGIEEQYAYYRDAGQSRSVAWDLTRAWVEAQIHMLFASPLTYCTVFVTVEKEGIELGTAAMGTDYSGEDSDYIFTMVEDYGMVEEAVQEAEAAIEKLTA
jgi:hypothetical protein